MESLRGADVFAGFPRLGEGRKERGETERNLEHLECRPKVLVGTTQSLGTFSISSWPSFHSAPAPIFLSSVLVGYSDCTYFSGLILSRHLRLVLTLLPLSTPGHLAPSPWDPSPTTDPLLPPPTSLHWQGGTESTMFSQEPCYLHGAAG